MTDKQEKIDTSKHILIPPGMTYEAVLKLHTMYRKDVQKLMNEMEKTK